MFGQGYSRCARYQLGYLILLAVTPILIWAAFHQDFLGEVLPRIGPAVPAAPKSD